MGNRAISLPFLPGDLAMAHQAALSGRNGWQEAGFQNGITIRRCPIRSFSITAMPFMGVTRSAGSAVRPRTAAFGCIRVTPVRCLRWYSARARQLQPSLSTEAIRWVCKSQFSETTKCHGTADLSPGRGRLHSSDRMCIETCFVNSIAHSSEMSPKALRSRATKLREPRTPWVKSGPVRRKTTKVSSDNASPVPMASRHHRHRCAWQQSRRDGPLNAGAPSSRAITVPANDGAPSLKSYPLVITGAGALPLPTKQPPRLSAVTTSASASATFFISIPLFPMGPLWPGQRRSLRVAQ